ncbi:ABC transporter permease [Alteromonas facilis]|uniref:ABC transporter permease n=1 Tax=Alteromonas facilis TaxID=2048004 RepID=UPI000C285715|nr:ABC transporter permease [Alteromonas facilis]
MLISIAISSLKDRRGAVIMTLLSIIVSVSLLLSVELIRQQAKDSFGRTVSGVDLIVGARTGQINLLLYSVFRMGNPSNNISWESYEAIMQSPSVAWSIPMSLGDSHRGYRVLGTTSTYFDHFKYGNKQPLVFSSGSPFDSPFTLVLGADVAKQLGYSLNDQIVLSHGVGHTSFHHHDHSPFTVSGILAPTGTPVDQTLHVSLQGIEIMHMSESDAHAMQQEWRLNQRVELQPDAISAAMLGLNSKIQALQLQRTINQYESEALMAILPGVALAELWKLVGNVENILLLISIFILFSSMMGMATMLLTSIRERQREFAILRAIGAGPMTIFWLIQAEALLISLLASIIAVSLVWLGIQFSNEWLSHEFGLFIDNTVLSSHSLLIVLFVCAMSLIIACIPAINAYRNTLHRGLSN